MNQMMPWPRGQLLEPGTIRYWSSHVARHQVNNQHSVVGMRWRLMILFREMP